MDGGSAEVFVARALEAALDELNLEPRERLRVLGAAFRQEALRSFDSADEDGALFEHLTALQAAERPMGTGPMHLALHALGPTVFARSMEGLETAEAVERSLRDHFAGGYGHR